MLTKLKMIIARILSEQRLSKRDVCFVITNWSNLIKKCIRDSYTFFVLKVKIAICAMGLVIIKDFDNDIKNIYKRVRLFLFCKEKKPLGFYFTTIDFVLLHVE